ncbi:MAG: hypothetical protein ASARMPRED_003407 [Alectoria sarmentosa]|nr:MAG: hypothetical protein ASARMPRED_003407 [Alectoria sarmentosa]
MNAAAAQDGLDLPTPLARRPSVFPFATTNGNTSTSVSNNNLTSLGAGPSIHCDDAAYGNPPVASCRDAVNQLPRDPYALIGPALSFGPRGRPGAQWDVSLPVRHISSDGKCIVDYTQTSYPSHVRLGDILGAGEIMQTQCVESGPPPFGGQASNMGKASSAHIGVEENFLVTVRSNRPPLIKCREAAPAQEPVSEACASILNTMNATEEKVIFGPAGASGVQEVLPQVLTEPTGRCILVISNASGFRDSASWYDLWAAAVALDGMCARGGKAGKAFSLGKMEQKRARLYWFRAC